MATPIPGAYPSPRIDKGVLRWYEGDTFSIVLRFDLKDQDGEAVTIGTTDSMAVVFLDDTRQTVHTFSFAKVENDQVTLNFDATVTAKFIRESTPTISGTRTATRRRWRAGIGHSWSKEQV